MKISKENLSNIIQKVMPAVEKKGIVEEMSHLAFDGAYVLTYNDKIAISYPLPEDFQLQCSVVATDFLSAVKAIRTKDVELEQLEDGLVVRGGKTVTLLPFFDEKKIAELHDSLDIPSIEDKFIDLPENFIDAIRTCKFSASDNVDHPKGMYAVAMLGDCVFATNGYQATLYPVVGVGTGFIKKPFVDAIVNFAPVAAVFTKSWLFFMNNDNAILSCRSLLLADKFPKDLEKVFFDFEKGFKFKEVIDDELTSLETFGEGDDKSDKTIIVTISKGKAILTGKSVRGEMTVECEIEGYEGEEVQFSINPNYLKECIKMGGEMAADSRMICMKTLTFKHLVALKVL